MSILFDKDNFSKGGQPNERLDYDHSSLYKPISQRRVAQEV
jgi:hypothetical protein